MMEGFVLLYHVLDINIYNIYIIPVYHLFRIISIIPLYLYIKHTFIYSTVWYVRESIQYSFVSMGRKTLLNGIAWVLSQ